MHLVHVMEEAEELEESKGHYWNDSNYFVIDDSNLNKSSFSVAVPPLQNDREETYEDNDEEEEDEEE